jgi:hypothetical protein
LNKSFYSEGEKVLPPDAQRVTAAVNRITLMLLQALPE